MSESFLKATLEINGEPHWVELPIHANKEYVKSWLEEIKNSWLEILYGKNNSYDWNHTNP